MHLRAVPLASSLPLQKLLFFNFYYSILFGAVHVAMMSYKIAYLQLDTAGLYAAPAILTVWALCEIARLRLGYAGNLKEKVPEMSAFWLLTLFPQLPFVLVLTFIQIMFGSFMPMDLAIGIWLLVFLVLELYFSFRAVRAFIRKQTADFYRLCQEESLAGEAAAEAARSFTPLVAATVLLPDQRGYQRVPTESQLNVVPGSHPPVGVGAIAQEGARHLIAGTDASSGQGKEKVG